MAKKKSGKKTGHINGVKPESQNGETPKMEAAPPAPAPVPVEEPEPSAPEPSAPESTTPEPTAPNASNAPEPAPAAPAAPEPAQGEKETLGALADLTLTEKHSSREEVDEDDLRQRLEQAESERDEIQEEYDTLLEKVGTIKERLGQRFKDLEQEAAAARAERDSVAAELAKLRAESKQELDREVAKEVAKAQAAIETYKKQCEDHQRTSDQFQRASEQYKAASEQHKKAGEQHKLSIEQFRAASEQYRLERDEARAALQVARDQQVSQKIMFDQEISNERMARETSELEAEQLKTKVESLSSVNAQTQRTCEIQESEIARLKQLVETETTRKTEVESQLKTVTASLESDRDAAREEIAALQTQLAAQAQTSSVSLTKQKKLETEVRESQLLIGKLRHEAVILNDHLTHALRLIRNDSEGSTVDKELVSNLFVQFATCPRQDTKKFEILQLIANFLGWDEQRRQSVGLEKGSSAELEQASPAPQPTQMVGVVGRLAEFIENRRNNK